MSKKLKKYNLFIKEASIEDNPAVPGDYKSRIEREEQRRLGIRTGDRGQEMQYGRQLMMDLEESKRLTSGKEKQLSELATELITSIYGDLLDRYDVELDIKLVKSGNDIKDFIDEESEDENEMQQFREIVDQDIKNEIHKRKIANLVIQGKAKGIKELLENEIVVEGIEKIYGRQSEKILTIWKRMSDTADKLDWLADPQQRARMMELNPEGFGGACKVDWKPKEKKEEDEEQEYKEYTGEESEEDMFDMEMDQLDKTPVVRARGVDFPMLLHEAVKGIYELLAVPGLPEEESVAQTVLMNTGLSDEPEDWKYGPRIAKDIMAFISKNERIDEFPNLREEFFRTILDRETMETKEFLDLIKGILQNTDEARAEVDSIIDEIISELDYDTQIKEYEEKLREYERQMKEWEASQKGEEVDEIEEIRKKSLSKLNLDDILDKIGEVGYDKLTPEEKNFLKQQSED